MIVAIIANKPDMLGKVVERQTTYALDRNSRKAAFAHFLRKAAREDESADITEEQRLAA